MEYGSFWGITVPGLVLLDLSSKDFARYVELLNNSTDSHRLRDLKEEINMCMQFLDCKIQMDYSDPEYRRKERSLKLSKEHYATGKQVAKSRLLSKEDMAIVEELLANTPKDVMSPYIINNGIRHDLSEPAIKILKFFLDLRYNLDRYKNGITINSFKERTVFGENLDRFIHKSGRVLKDRVVKQITEVKQDARLLERTLAGISADITVLADIANKTLNGVEETKGNNLAFEHGRLKNNTSFSAHQIEFLKYLDGLKLLNEFSLEQLKALANFYDKICEVDVDMYNSLFELNLAQAEYEKVFDELDSVGFVGLNFEYKQFYLNAFLSVVMGSNYVAKMPLGSTLISAALEADRLLSTQLKYGEVLN